jgi:hypothetical protein
VDCSLAQKVDADSSIPTILGINLAVWLVLLLVFLALCHFLPEYSRVGLHTNRRRRSLLRKKFSTRREALLASEELQREETEDEEDTDPLLYSEYEEHWYSWIINFFRLNDDTIRQRCGPDAVVYLSLERHIIVLLCIFSFLSIVVILPINVYGDLDRGGFAGTTISNIDATKKVLWVHTFFSLLYLLITGAFMIRFSLKLGKFQQDMSRHTVMIQWIPPIVHREDILLHFQEALPNSQVADLQFAYDVSTLTQLSKKLEKVQEQLQSVGSVREELGEVERIRPGWSKLFFWRQGYLVDAQTHYEAERVELTRRIAAESVLVRGKRLTAGFLSFTTERDALQVVQSYKPCRARPTSTMSESVLSWRWWVSHAPFPLDIQWENLHIPSVVWWSRWLLINIVLCLFLFFFTTAPVLLASVNQISAVLLNGTDINLLEKELNSVSPLVNIYISNLLLLAIASLLVYCVSRSYVLECYWTQSQREQAIMRKTFIFLVLMLIVLPSIGLTSVSALAESVIKHSSSLQQKLNCVFLPGSGAFFVVYVMTSGLMGTAVELLRLPELGLYLYYRVTARTRWQKEQALKKAGEWDFLYGVQYAWHLVIFTMVITYSVTTPLITPFGVLYFILRYFTDKYNIYYVYRPAPFNGRQFLHRTAINFVIVGAVHLQISTLFFSVVRLGRLDPRTVLMIVALSLTLAACVGFMLFGWFSHMLPQLRLKMGKEYRIFSLTREGGVGREEMQETVTKGAYIPPVLKRFSSESAVPGDNSVTGYQSFGCTDKLGRQSPTSSRSPDSPRSTTSPETSSPERKATKAQAVKPVKPARDGSDSLDYSRYTPLVQEFDPQLAASSSRSGRHGVTSKAAAAINHPVDTIMEEDEES